MQETGKSICYCIKLRRAANLVTDLYDGYLAPLGLSVTQYSLLSKLRKLEHCSVSELANYVGLERTTVVRTLKPLIEKGWVEDISSKKVRNRELIVTEDGIRILDQGEPMWIKAQEEIESRIGEEDIDTLNRILSQLLM